MPHPIDVPLNLRPPMLYKYCGPSGIAILESGYLFLTQPILFNDPFELKPHCAETVFVQAGDGPMSALPGMRIATSDEMLKVTNTVVLSLSERRDSLLMWAHYADAHQGLVIGFSGQVELLGNESSHRITAPVDYRDQRPSKARSEDITDADVFLAKGRDWETEREWRVVDSLYSADQDKPDASGRRWAFRIRSDAVQEVILGCRASAELERRVVDVLRRPEYSTTRLFQACPHMSEYRLELTECPRAEWAASSEPRT